MKYKLIQTSYANETMIDEKSYSIDAYLTIECTDGIAPLFSKMITITNLQIQNGFEIDAQRELEIENYMKLINEEK